MRSEQKREADRLRYQRIKADPVAYRQFLEQCEAKRKRYRQDPEWREKRRVNSRVQSRVRHHRWPVASTFLCSDCDAKALEYHHEDYSLWWSVEPLCKVCHGKRHYVN